MSTEKSPWIKLSEHKPTESDFPFVLASCGKADRILRPWGTIGIDFLKSYDHWLPIPPPPKEPTQEEKDYAIALSEWKRANAAGEIGMYTNPLDAHRQGFLAALKHARSQSQTSP